MKASATVAVTPIVAAVVGVGGNKSISNSGSTTNSGTSATVEMKESATAGVTQIAAAVAEVAPLVRMAAMVNIQAAGRKAGRQAGIR